MTTERRRRLLCAVLLAVAILGAGMVTTSVLADPAWRVALQIAGLGACAAALGTAAMVLRHWSLDDDFWWLDTDRDA